MRDIDLQATEDFKLFATRVDTGAPTDVASIAVSAYPDNSTTQLTAGITTTQPFDSVTGFGNVRVVATVANGYAYGSTYSLVITTGTVNSISVVGAIVGEFTIGKNRPGLVRMGLCQASTSTTVVFDAATSFADNFLNGHFVFISAGTGAGQSRYIDTWTNSTDTGTVTPAWITTPDTTSVFQCYASPPASTGVPVPANATQILGTAISTPAVAGILDVNAIKINNVATSSVTAVGANIGHAQPLNFTGSASSALVKSDMVDIAGAAVSATTAQLGVNIVKINNVTLTGAGTSGSKWGP